jgi:hypothetical protein
MSNFTDAYEMTGKITDTGISFFFLSEGKKDVFKNIEYSYVLDHQGKKVFNLAFGDYSFKTGTFYDEPITNNGDPYKVYHTVLATIPHFFRTFEDALLMIRGSDSTREFLAVCHRTCNRKCGAAECKKAHRRINIYRNYVDKHFDSLTKEYIFSGSLTSFENQLVTEDYVKGKKYLTVLLKKT